MECKKQEVVIFSIFVWLYIKLRNEAFPTSDCRFDLSKLLSERTGDQIGNLSRKIGILRTLTRTGVQSTVWQTMIFSSFWTSYLSYKSSIKLFETWGYSRSDKDLTVQWWLQIRKFSLIWHKISKMANKGISDIPLFDIKLQYTTSFTSFKYG